MSREKSTVIHYGSQRHSRVSEGHPGGALVGIRENVLDIPIGSVVTLEVGEGISQGWMDRRTWTVTVLEPTTVL